MTDDSEDLERDSGQVEEESAVGEFNEGNNEEQTEEMNEDAENIPYDDQSEEVLLEHGADAHGNDVEVETPEMNEIKGEDNGEESDEPDDGSDSDEKDTKEDEIKDKGNNDIV
ncbi:hypothetical protein BLNAU_16385 [Blattamonas nauphoetae]|uniref:Uncharacterized protein n=1 Tax=Blattamonas nauphoetae TaxID=2049346 RepID=A0ABQ9XB86_9EUKA|nr:hypothetical protein BLNAU_16385 [Blattamonas nauphoetae]